jgi:hypothetical protein
MALPAPRVRSRSERILGAGSPAGSSEMMGVYFSPDSTPLKTNGVSNRLWQEVFKQSGVRGSFLLTNNRHTEPLPGEDIRILNRIYPAKISPALTRLKFISCHLNLA